MQEDNEGAGGPRLDRRAALARLGLAAAGAYVAPALTMVSSAHASSGKGSGRPSKARRHRDHCGGSGGCRDGFREGYRDGYRDGSAQAEGYPAERYVYRDPTYYQAPPPLPPRRPAGIYIELPDVEITIRP